MIATLAAMVLLGGCPSGSEDRGESNSTSSMAGYGYPGRPQKLSGPLKSVAAGLSAFAATAAFLGNQTVIVDRALNPASGRASALLLRESNCSLTQIAFSNYASVGGTRVLRGQIPILFV